MKMNCPMDIRGADGSTGIEHAYPLPIKHISMNYLFAIMHKSPMLLHRKTMILFR